MDAAFIRVLTQGTITLLLCTVILLIFHLYRTFTYWQRRGIPYDSPGLLLGNLGFLMRSSFWEYFLELKKKHPRDYVGIYLGWKPALVIQTPELAKKILSTDSQYFEDRYLYCGHADPLGKLNLFTVKNPLWTQMRHNLSPLFTSSRLRSLTDLMNINANQLVQRIKQDYIEDKKPVALRELFSMYTSDSVAYSVFGIRVSVLRDRESPLWFITNHMVKWTFWRGLEFHLIFFLPALANLLRVQFFSRAATDYVKRIFYNVVDERKKTNNLHDKDLVNHLIRLKDASMLPKTSEVNPDLVDIPDFAENLMLAQVAVFILGSIETSSTLLTMCLHELAHHPEEQEKLYAEVANAMKETGKQQLQYDDLIELKYLTACLIETGRKYQVLAHYDRICEQPYKLTDEVTIEKGVPVLVNVMAIHYDEKIFPEPEKWIPGRVPNVEDSLQSFALMPFGEGPRFCIGKRYGMMQMRAAVAQLIYHYKFEPGPVPYESVPDPYSVILAPKNGGSVKFVTREH